MKRLSEINEGTVWGGVIKRSIGQQDVRKEDRKSPFFGRGIEYKFYNDKNTDIELYLESKLDDILENNPGWRLPTLEDIKSISYYKNDETKLYKIRCRESEDDNRCLVLESPYGELEIMTNKYFIGNFWLDDKDSEGLRYKVECRFFGAISNNPYAETRLNNEKFGVCQVILINKKI